MSSMSAALIISYIAKFLLPARFRPYDLVTAICDAEWAKSTAVVVSITKFWHWMWWWTLLLLLLLLNLLLAGHCHHTYGSVDFCKHRYNFCHLCILCIMCRKGICRRKVKIQPLSSRPSAKLLT